jgi:hypothetical protein
MPAAQPIRRPSPAPSMAAQAEPPERPPADPHILPSHAYQAAPGGLAERILMMMAANAGEYYTSGDLALKYDLNPSMIGSVLQSARLHGLVDLRGQRGETDRVWVALPPLQTWAQARRASQPAAAQAPAPAPVPAAEPGAAGAATPPAAAPKRRTKGIRNGWPPVPLPPLAELRVENGVGLQPLPQMRGVPGKWEAVLGLLKAVGDSVAIPLAAKGAVAAYLQKRKRDRQATGRYRVGRCERQPKLYARIIREA